MLVSEIAWIGKARVYVSACVWVNGSDCMTDGQAGRWGVGQVDCSLGHSQDVWWGRVASKCRELLRLKARRVLHER